MLMRLCLDLNKLHKLVIAALNGHTVGGGLEIAMAADIRIAHKGNFQIGLPEVSLGVLAGTGGTARLITSSWKSKGNGDNGYWKKILIRRS